MDSKPIGNWLQSGDSHLINGHQILSLSYLITTATNFAYSIIHNLSDASRQINVFKLKFVTNDPKIVGLALENWSVKK